MKYTRCIDAAIERLRKIAEQRAVHDERGVVKYEGTPTPDHVRAELERVYLLGYRRGVKAGRP